MTEVKEKYWPQIFAGSTGAGGFFLMGMVIGWSAQLYVPLVVKDAYGFKVDKEEYSWMSSIVDMGSVSNAILAGYLSGIIGRKTTLVALTIPMIIGWILVCAAVHPAMVMVGRYMQGLGCGGLCVVSPLYIGEISSKKIRGFIGGMTQVMVTLGILVSLVFGGYIKLLYYHITCILLTLLLTVLFSIIPESPAFYVNKGKDEKAVKSIRWLRGKNFDPTEELAELKAELEARKAFPQNQCKSLCQRYGIISLVIGITMMFYQQASGVSVVTFFTGRILMVSFSLNNFFSDKFTSEY